MTFKHRQVKLVAFAITTLISFSVLTSIHSHAAIGDGVSTLVDNLYTELAPIINSIAILAIGIGGITFITAGGNIDKRSIGKRVFFGALGGILVYNIAPGIVEWSSSNLTISF